ncbi:MAG TPA: hypothetical protein PKA64_17755, partial [Myxococcota bacterium]|nr:hypothetical protein [Myxococcota bacterium]
DAWEPALSAPAPVGLAVDDASLRSTCGGSASLIGGALAWSAPSHVAPCALSYDATVLPDRTPGADAVLPDATLTWTGQPGDQRTSVSPYSTLAVERTGSQADPGGAANTYRVQAGARLPVTSATLALADEQLSTDLLGAEEIGAGEQIVRTYRVTVPEGTANGLMLQVTLPPSVSLTSARLDRSAFEGTIGNDPTPTLTAGPGAVVAMPFGAVTLPSRPGTRTSSFDVVLTTQVALDPNTWSADDLAWDAQLLVGATVVGAQIDPVRVVHAEPRFSLTVSDDTPSGLDEIELLGHLENTGDGPLVGARLRFVIPAGLTLVDPATDGLDNDANGTIDDEPAGAGASWTLDLDPIAPGGALDLPVHVTQDLLPPARQLIPSLVLARYTTYASGSAAIDPQRDGLDNDQDFSVDEALPFDRDDTAYVDVYPEIPLLRMTKTWTASSGGAAQPGDVVTFTLHLSNDGNAPSTSVRIEDDIDGYPVAAFQPGSEATTEGAIAVVGGTLQVDVDVVPIAGTVDVTFDVLVDDPLPAGLTVVNQARFSQDLYPSGVSDDPNTGAANDPTVVRISTGNDPDGDGVPTPLEQILGTDPNDPDTDHDGLNDGLEIGGLTDTDPLDPDTDHDGVCDGPAPEPLDVCSGAEDTNGDGLIGPDETDPNDADSDDDHMIDGDEALIGTDPLDPDSDDDGLLDGDEAAYGASPLDTDTDDDGVPDPVEVAQGTAPDDTDSDDDGLDDFAEGVAGTDPLDPDSDDDRLLDGDPREPDPLDADADDDGLTDGEEVLDHQTSPTDTDSDDDGVTDDVEVAAGMDPNDTDSDDDGWADADELASGTDPLDPDSDDDRLIDGDEIAAGTDPLDPDSDDDGALDGDEVTAGTDPLDPDSDDDGLTDGQ